MRQNAFVCFLAALTFMAAERTPSFGDGPSVGDEFQVNTFTTGHQAYPALGVSATGAFTVVWQSDAQDGHQEGIFARRYDSTGTPLDAAEFQVNTYTTGSQARPAIAVAPSGDFVVTWIDQKQVPYTGIVARRFASTGMPLDAAEFHVSTSTDQLTRSPQVAVAATGEFTVVWESVPPTGWDPLVFARRFDSSGNALDPEQVPVSEFTNVAAYRPSVGVADSGAFVVVWDAVYLGVAGSVRGRRFDSDGTPLGGDFQISPWGQCCGAVSVAPAGSFVVATLGYSYGGPYRVIARRFDSSGSPLDPNGIVVQETTLGLPGFPALDAGDQGDFVVVWPQWQETGSGFSYDIEGRRFSSSGTALDAIPFRVNSYAPASARHPSVGLARSGRFVVSWSNLHQDGDQAGVFAQRFTCPGSDGDGSCIAITNPEDGALLRCPSPSESVEGPRIEWLPGAYDRFRAAIAWDAGFAKGDVIDSGPVLLDRTSWQPAPGQWRKACRQAAPGGLFIRVYGEDTDLDPSDPSYSTFSDAVTVGTLEAAPANRSRRYLAGP